MRSSGAMAPVGECRVIAQPRTSHTTNLNLEVHTTGCVAMVLGEQLLKMMRRCSSTTSGKTSLRCELRVPRSVTVATATSAKKHTSLCAERKKLGLFCVYGLHAADGTSRVSVRDSRNSTAISLNPPAVAMVLCKGQEAGSGQRILRQPKSDLDI